MSYTPLRTIAKDTSHGYRACFAGGDVIEYVSWVEVNVVIFTAAWKVPLPVGLETRDRMGEGRKDIIKEVAE